MTTAAKKTTSKTPATKIVKEPMTAIKPIKEPFNKTSLVAHLVQASGAEAKTVKAVLDSLEAAILGSLSKNGAGEFTWPGVFKVAATHVPAQKARQGVDPFTKVERMFAAKPASVKVKARFFKKVKDAAL